MLDTPVALSGQRNRPSRGYVRLEQAEMTKTGQILPMRHRVAVVVYPGFELLDATGPASVFANANGVQPPKASPLYEIEFCRLQAVQSAAAAV